jgi:flagellar motor switch/type III secretory pathway protein FliN
MKMLGFARRGCIVNGRRIRPSVFEPRSTLPVSAACLVANAARRTLSELLGVPVRLKLLEPVLPDSAGWSSIGTNAQVFAVGGEHSDAAIVLRAHDALALACAALGERAEGPRDLSAIENELAARIAAALCASLTPVCGARDPRQIERVTTLAGYVAYFELILEEPVEARIGIALSREPRSQIVPALTPADLHEIDVRLGVEIAHAFLPAASIVSLRAGEVIKLDSVLGDAARLLAGGAVLARGQCGNLGMRRALAIQ